MLTLYAPILIGNAVDLIIGKGSVDFDAIGRILFRLAGIIVITSAAQWLMNLCNNHITYRVVKDVRTKAFAKLQKLPLKYVDSHAYGETISRIITDVEQFSDGLLMGFTQFFTGVVTILGNPGIYAPDQCEDCVGCNPDHAGIFVCGKLYCEENLCVF